MHVEDCADIIAEVVKNSKLAGIYNVKGHETYSVKDLVQQVEDHFGIKFEKSFSQDLPWENIDSLDDSKLRSTIDLRPQWHLFNFMEKEFGIKAYA